MGAGSHRGRYDVIVVGAGHNGLATAGLLAKAGQRVLVLERREQVGGAAVTEQPWGPDFNVTSLSYVVSLMAPTVVQELELERHGYKVYPQHGYFAPFADGRVLHLAGDLARQQAAVASFASVRDAEAYGDWDRQIGELGQLLGPLLSSVPPRIGGKRLRDIWSQLGLAWRMRGLDTRQVGELTRLMTMSVADLLDEVFESEGLKGVMSVSGIIGSWAGPRAPGTGFVLAHHKIGDIGDGAGASTGTWGFPEGGMGGMTRAMARAAESFGAELRTCAAVERILVDDAQVRGVVLEGGDELLAPKVVSTTHPSITFLQHLERDLLPPDFLRQIERWKSRSGTVKINLAIDRLPEFSARPGFDPEVHGGTIVLAESIDELETSFQQAVSGSASQRPFADICIPSVFDPTLAPEGKHVMSMFTQWVPCQWAGRPHTTELDAYADRVIARVEDVAPGFTSSILHRQVIGPHQMQDQYGLVGGNIFHGELSAGQIFHMRPASGFADYRTPIRGLFNASSASHGGGGCTAIPALQVARLLGAGV